VNGLVTTPRDWLASQGDISRFASRVIGLVSTHPEISVIK